MKYHNFKWKIYKYDLSLPNNNAKNRNSININVKFFYVSEWNRNEVFLFVGCEFVTRIFTFASVHVKDFTFFLVLVRRVSKEIIILHFCLECHHISRTTKRVDEIMKQQET